MNTVWLVLFSISAGFTASAIIANLYRVTGMQAQNPGGKALRSAVLVVAGPSVLFESAMRGLIGKTWHPMSFWLAAAIVLYWSLAVGLVVMEIATRF